MLYRAIFTFLAASLVAGTAFAQAATESSSPSASIRPSVQATAASTTASPTQSPTAADYRDIKTSFVTKAKAPLAWLRFRRFVSLNPVKDSELTLAISNRLVAQIAAAEPAKAASLLEAYSREATTLQELVDTVLSSNNDPKVSTFLSTLMSDKTAQIAALEQANVNSGSELARKIVNTRAKALKEVVKILEHPNLSPAEQQERLDAVMEKYGEAAAKIDRKIDRKLALKREIDEQTEDEELEDALAEKEDEALKEASEKLNKDELADFADELRRKEGGKSLVVLQKLLGTVPEAARGGIETAIDAVLAKQIETFRQKPAAIEELLREHSGSTKVRTLLLERIKERAGDENLKQQVELIKAKPEERSKKLEERRKESEKKAKESRGEKSSEPKKSPEAKVSEEPKETKSPAAAQSTKPVIDQSTPSPKPSPSTELKSETSTVELKINADAKPEKTSYTVKKNSTLTVKVVSAAATPVTVNFSNGLGSITLNKEESKNLSPFVITSTTSFTVNSTTGYIYIE